MKVTVTSNDPGARMLFGLLAQVECAREALTIDINFPLGVLYRISCKRVDKSGPAPAEVLELARQLMLTIPRIGEPT